MATRKGDPKLSAGHQLRIATRRRHLIGDEADVETPRHQPSSELARRAFEELNEHLRLICTEVDQKFSEKAWKEGGKNTDPKQPLLRPAGRSRILHRLINLPEPHARALKKAPTRDCHSYAALTALEERDAQFVLERLDTATHR